MSANNESSSPVAAPSESPPGERCWLTAGDVSRALHVDLKTVHHWVARGKLRGRRTRGGHLRFRHVELVRYVRRVGAVVPADFSLAAPRVLAVGLSAEATLAGGMSASESLLSGALELASGDYDVLVMNAATLQLTEVHALLGSLRRCAVTADLAVVVLHDDPRLCADLLQRGADAAGPEAALAVALRRVTGHDDGVARLVA